MNKKVLIFWATTGVGFIIAVFLSLFIGSKDLKSEVITFDLEVEPGVFYQTGGKFHINTDSHGYQEFSYFSTFSTLNQYRYLQFTDVDISLDHQVLVQIRKGGKVLFEEEMLKGNALMLELPWAGLSDLKLKEEIELKFTFSPQTDFGQPKVGGNDIAFGVISLTSDSLTSRWDYLYTSLIHQPTYKLSSLNYWQKHSMSLQLALALMFWLFGSLLSAWILKISSSQIMIFLMVIIAPSSVGFCIKQWHLKQQSSELFSIQEDFSVINKSDKNVKAFADSFLMWHEKQTKKDSIVVIQTFDSFLQSRLLYRLHSLNVIRGVTWSSLNILKTDKGVDTVYVVMTEQFMPGCQWDEDSVFATIDDVNLIMKQSGFCVVEL